MGLGRGLKLDGEKEEGSTFDGIRKEEFDIRWYWGRV
jgi:hypothetical protein